MHIKVYPRCLDHQNICCSRGLCFSLSYFTLRISAYVTEGLVLFRCSGIIRKGLFYGHKDLVDSLSLGNLKLLDLLFLIRYYDFTNVA